MASAGAVRAGAAYVELSLNQDKFLKGLQGAFGRLKGLGKTISGWGDSLGGLGTKLFGGGMAVGGGLFAAAKTWAASGDELQRMSVLTGVSVEALSELRYAAKMTDTDFADVGVAFKFMQRAIGEAANGSKQAKEALLRLGLAAGDLQTLSPDKQLEVLAARLKELPSHEERVAAAMKIFGRSGTSLLPLLERMGELRAEAKALGLTMTAQSARDAHEFDETLKRLWITVQKVVGTIGAAAAPVFSEWAAKALEAAQIARDWIKDNQGLVQSLLKLAGGVAAGAGLMILGPLVSKLGAVLTTVGSIGSSVMGFLLTPLGQVTALLVAGGAVWMWWSGEGNRAMTWLGETWDWLKGRATQTWGGIVDALKAGNLGLAAEIAWAGLKLVWLEGTQNIREWWADAWAGIQDATRINGVTLLTHFKNLWLNLVKGWTWFQKTVDDILEGGARALEETRIAKEMDDLTKRRDATAAAWKKENAEYQQKTGMKSWTEVSPEKRTGAVAEWQVREGAARAKLEGFDVALENRRKWMLESVAEETEAEKKYQKQLEAIEQKIAANKANDPTSAQLRKEAEAKKAAIRARLSDARQRLADLTQQAADELEKARGKNAAPEPKAAPELPRVQAEVKAQAETAVRGETAGTFLGRTAAWGMGLGTTTVQERMVKAVEQTAKATEETADSAEETARNTRGLTTALEFA